MEGCGDDICANGDMRGAAGGAFGEAFGAAPWGAAGAAGATGTRGGVSRGGADVTARSFGGVTARGRDGMLVSADVRACCGADCDPKDACIGCGGVGIETGGRGGSGAVTDDR